jgi:hypothetical protein
MFPNCNKTIVVEKSQLPLSRQFNSTFIFFIIISNLSLFVDQKLFFHQTKLPLCEYAGMEYTAQENLNERISFVLWIRTLNKRVKCCGSAYLERHCNLS